MEEEITIVYSSKYGSTKEYAQELHRRRGGKLLPIKHFNAKKVETNVVVFFAPIYAFGLLNLSVLERSITRLRNKKVAVFCVGASPYKPKEFRRLYRKNFDGPLKDIPAFYGRGAWQLEKMTSRDKLMLKLVRQKIKTKTKSKMAPWEEEFLSFYKKSWNWVDFSYLDPVEEWMDAKSPFEE